jgi:hypothetical protein
VLFCTGDIGSYAKELKEHMRLKIKSVDGNKITAKASVWQIKKMLGIEWIERIELKSSRGFAPALKHEERKQMLRLVIDCSNPPADYVEQIEGLGARIIDVEDNVVIAETDDDMVLYRIGHLNYVMRVHWSKTEDIREKICTEDDMWILDLPDDEVIQVRLIMRLPGASIDNLRFEEILERGDDWVLAILHMKHHTG